MRIRRGVNWVAAISSDCSAPLEAERGLLWRIGFVTLLAFVFTIPWEGLTLVAGADTVSKLVGFSIVFPAFLGILDARRATLHAFLWVALLFSAWSFTTYFWSISPADTLSKGFTLLQLWVAAWLIFQYADSDRAIRVILAAYALGSIVTSVGLLEAFFSGALLRYSGYTLGHFNPNTLAYYVALAATTSWYLGRTAKRWATRNLFWTITGLSTVVVVLTASRGGVIILGLSLMYAIVSLRRFNVWGKVVALSVLVLTLWIALSFTPLHILDRLATIVSEVHGGTLDYRITVWKAGLSVFPQHPFLGSGASTFQFTIAHITGFELAAHNVFIQILVETGLIGFVIWIATLSVAAGWLVGRGGGQNRLFWSTIGVQLLLCLMTANFEWRKMVWLMLALLAAAGVQYRNMTKEHIRRRIAETYHSSTE